MKFTLKLILSLSAIYSSSCGVIPTQEETELILVSVLFRHGARTTYAFYPTDPNKDNDFYPIGLGGLTNEGKLGEFVLGRYFKAIYGDFLGEDYTESKVEIRSTDVSRTKMSAQLVLAGLFPPSAIQQWNPELMWQPIPISYKIESEEDLFHPTVNCPYKVNVLDNQPNVEEVQELYINPYKEVFDFIQNKSGKSISHPGDMQDFFFIVKTEGDMNLNVPDWTKEIFPEPTQSIAANVYGYHNYDSRVKQINAGYMLKKIMEDSKQKIDGSLNPKERKLYLYSGHESTLGYMLNALNIYKVHVPPYGAALSFEIRKGGDEHFVRIRYRNDTEANEPIDLAIPGCDLLCPFDKFVDLQKDLIPTISIEEACKIDASSATPSIN